MSASTKAGRRRENWGTANTVRPTQRRSYTDAGHRPPRSGVDRHGRPWIGSSRRPIKRQPSWRDWYREAFLAMWRKDRAAS